MNVIRPDFPPSLQTFFKNLQYYLDTELYFYGSVVRHDYVHNQSDIDVAIFTDNEYSTIAKLQHFLHVKRNAFDKVAWKLEGRMLYGYKIKCHKHVPELGKCEIVVYNNDFKDQLLHDMRRYVSLPLWVNILLFWLKTFHYTIPLLPEHVYSECKRTIFNKWMINKEDTVFFLLKAK